MRKIFLQDGLPDSDKKCYNCGSIRITPLVYGEGRWSATYSCNMCKTIHLVNFPDQQACEGMGRIEITFK